jgi:lauroyl/myristoyl acyltransferase
MIIASAPLLPRRLRLSLARTIALLFQSLMPREHAAARHNLQRILPQAEPRILARVTRCLFGNFAMVLADVLSLNRQELSLLQRVVHRVHGQEVLHAMLTSGRGFVAATAHMGNWDLAGRLLSTYGKAVAALVAPEQATGVQRLLRDHSNAPQLRFVTNNEPGVFVQLLMALRRGEIVAIQADRTMGPQRVAHLPFFNLPAAFPSAPFVLAAAAQVPVLPCFCLLRPDRQYDIFVEAPIVVVRGQEEAALRHMVGVLERYITRAPDQWFNFYDVWDNATAI